MSFSQIRASMMSDFDDPALCHTVAQHVAFEPRCIAWCAKTHASCLARMISSTQHGPRTTAEYNAAQCNEELS